MGKERVLDRLAMREESHIGGGGRGSSMLGLEGR